MFSDFVDSFSDSYKNNFSYEGKRALYDYLNSMSDDTGEDIELDTVALCCDYTEYESFEKLKEDYPNIEDMEDLENYTSIIIINDKKDSFIIQQF